MKTKFKFDASQIDLVKGAIDSFQNQAIKDAASNYVIAGGKNNLVYSRGTYSQFYSRGVVEPTLPDPIIVAS